MKLAYVTTYDSSDIHMWSGLGYHIHKALQECGFQTECIGNLRVPRSLILKVKRLFYAKILSKTYFLDREPAILKSYASQVENSLLFTKCDMIFSPGTIPIAYLCANKPIIFWTDATFAGMINFYPSFSNLCAETIKNGNKMEQLALSKCRLAIYSSDWAANTAIQNYDVDPAKVKVVPFGANIDCKRNITDVRSIIEGKEFSVCKLLFIGVDWVRKGGNLALKIAERLNAQGLYTELHVVGCAPPFNVPNFVRLHGFLSKRTEQGRKHLSQLFAQSHFLILPSRADCVPVVLAEACSFGLPSLVTDIGGISTAIRNGINGKIFAVEEGPDRYCEYIAALMTSKQDYQHLALSSFKEYSDRLNWSAAGKRVQELIYEFCI